MTTPGGYQPRPKLPNEFALAVACCRWTYSGQGADEVRMLAEAADWGNFLQTCRRHRVQGLAWHALSGLGVALPAPVHIALAGDARAVADQGLRAARESARLCDAFRAAGIPLLFLKGLTLGKLAYGNPFLKMGWDIDILVLSDDVVSAALLLATLDYELKMPRNAALLPRWHRFRNQSLWRLSDEASVELHSRVTDLPGMLPTISASSPLQMVAVAPRVELPTLREEELFAYLCVHGGWSAWFRLKWITDLAALLHRSDAQEIAALYNRSQELGASRTASQALLLAGMLYGIPLSNDLADRLNTPLNHWLTRAALRRMLGGEPTEQPLGTLPIHLSHFFLKGGFRYKLAELRRKVRAVAGLF
jgi:hypothetical protein